MQLSAFDALHTANSKPLEKGMTVCKYVDVPLHHEIPMLTAVDQSL